MNKGGVIMTTTKCLKNGVPIYVAKEVDLTVRPIDIALKAIDENYEQLKKIDKMAKSKGELLGRYVDVPVADGKAIYQIMRVNKNTVRLKALGGFGDDYILDYWGIEASVDKEYVISLVRNRDKLDEIFGRR